MQRIPRLKTIIFYSILLWIAYQGGIAIVHAKISWLFLLIGLSGLAMVPFFISKIGTFPLFCGLVFMYWIPFGRIPLLPRFLQRIQLFEFIMWIFFVGILIHGSLYEKSRLNSAIKRLPFLPFSLFIGGSLITFLISESHLGALYELAQIRISVLLPACICFLCIYLIKNVKQASQLLWAFLISSGLLGFAYIYGPKGVTIDPSILDIPSIEEGRILRIIKLPLMDYFGMNPEVTAVLYAFIVALSFNLLLNHPTFKGRLLAVAILVISGLVIITAQGRMGLMAAGTSVIIITALTLKFRAYPVSLFWKSLLKAGVTISLVLGGAWYYAVISPYEHIQLRGITFFTNPLHAEGLDLRLWRWKESFLVFLKNPFGVGFGGFPTHLEISGNSWFAHNLYLYLLLSIGIIGLIGFFWLLVRIAKAYWFGVPSNSIHRRTLCIGGIGCITVLLIGGIASCIYWNSWEVLMAWIPIGITLAVATSKDERANNINKKHR